MSAAPTILRREIGPASGRGGLREVWRHRELLRSLVLRDLKVKYQRSALGLIWTLLNPLLTVAVLTAVFSYIIRIQMDQYWAFLLSGYFTWNFLQQVLYNSTSVLRDHAALSRSVAFPTEILVLSTCLSRLVEYLVEILLVMAVLVTFHFQAVPSALLLFPLLVAIQLIMGVGLMLPLSVVGVLFYDIQHALPIIITTLFYLSPVFYPVTMIPEAMRPVYHLNPSVGLLGLYHTVLYVGAWPSLSALMAVGMASVGICAIGYAIFKRYRDLCVEIA